VRSKCLLKASARASTSTGNWPPEAFENRDLSWCSLLDHFRLAEAPFKSQLCLLRARITVIEFYPHLHGSKRLNRMRLIWEYEARMIQIEDRF